MVRKWVRRHQEEVPSALEGHSRRPKSSPHKVSPEVEEESPRSQEEDWIWKEAFSLVSRPGGGDNPISSYSAPHPKLQRLQRQKEAKEDLLSCPLGLGGGGTFLSSSGRYQRHPGQGNLGDETLDPYTEEKITSVSVDIL